MMKGLLLIFGWLLLGSATAWAYEEIQVTDGGTVTGKVTITAGKPIPKGFNLVTFPDPVYCGKNFDGDRVADLEGIRRGGGRRTQGHGRLAGGCDERQTIQI